MSMLAMSEERRPRRGAVTDSIRLAPYRAVTALKAEISEPGAWHVLLVTPGQENLVSAHLAGRGFGLYVPIRRALIGPQGLVPCHPTPELAGYVLAFLWAGEHGKVRKIPGVKGFLSNPDGKPVILSDAEVKGLREHEAKTDLALATRLEEIETGKYTRKPRRRRRRSKRARFAK